MQLSPWKKCSVTTSFRAKKQWLVVRSSNRLTVRRPVSTLAVQSAHTMPLWKRLPWLPFQWPFQVYLGWLVALLASFFHQFWNRTFGYNWQRYFTGMLPFLCNQTNSVKAPTKAFTSILCKWNVTVNLDLFHDCVILESSVSFRQLLLNRSRQLFTTAV